MPLKIAVTVCDVGNAVHADGDPQRVTSIIELSDEQVPAILTAYLENEQVVKRARSQGPAYSYRQVTFSIVE